MTLGILTLYLHLPGCSSLKEKRSRIKPMLLRLHREFNVSVAEIGEHDVWQNAVIGCALVSNDAAHIQRSLHKIVEWLEHHWKDVELVNETFEILNSNG